MFLKVTHGVDGRCLYEEGALKGLSTEQAIRGRREKPVHWGSPQSSPHSPDHINQADISSHEKMRQRTLLRSSDVQRAFPNIQDS